MDFPSTFSVGYLTFLEKDFLELIHLVLSVDEEQLSRNLKDQNVKHFLWCCWRCTMYTAYLCEDVMNVSGGIPPQIITKLV